MRWKQGSTLLERLGEQRRLLVQDPREGCGKELPIAAVRPEQRRPDNQKAWQGGPWSKLYTR